MEPGMIPLEKRFRLLLLLAFPLHYRRSRGAEMLTTLLDGSLPGQRWPTMRSALSVVWSGIRCRFRLRPGKFSRIAAVATALAGAVFGGVLGTWVAWNTTAGPLPSDAEADAIARSIVVAEPYSRERYDFLFGTDPGLGQKMPGGVWYWYDDEHGSVQEQAMQALRANGWAVSSWQCRGCAGPVGIAVKGDVRVMMSSLILVIGRATPAAVPWFMAIGALLGTYGGWMLTARIGRLLARRTPWQKTAVSAVATAGFLALLPCLYYTVGWSILYYIALDLSPDGFARAPFWVFSWGPVRNVTFAGLAAILLAVASAELAPRRASGGQSIAR